MRMPPSQPGLKGLRARRNGGTRQRQPSGASAGRESLFLEFTFEEKQTPASVTAN